MEFADAWTFWLEFTRNQSNVRQLTDLHVRTR